MKAITKSIRNATQAMMNRQESRQNAPAPMKTGNSIRGIRISFAGGGRKAPSRGAPKR